MGTLVPSLHSSVLNPNIDFAQTPFVVQQELAPWPRPVLDIGGVKREYPRIAGISSFGAGGANAHVVIEEYREPVRQRRSMVPRWSCCRRARKSVCANSAQRLLALPRCRTRPSYRAGRSGLHAAGRVARRWRSGSASSRIRPMIARETACLRGGRNGDRRAVSRAGQTQQGCAGRAAGDDDMDDRRGMDRQGQVRQVAGPVGEGPAFDWQRLYAQDLRPRRISLPTYPFARERYWIPIADARHIAAAATAAGCIR
jgi:polyketide synthase PksN